MAEDDNNKPILHIFEKCSYGECTYAEIAEKLEKISRNNKSWSTNKSDTGRNTFVVQATHILAADEIQKVDAVNYMAKPTPPVDECYYEEDIYEVNDQMGVSNQTRKAPITRIGIKVKEIKVGTMVTTIEKAFTTRGGKQTIDPPMPSVVEYEMIKDEEVVETSGEFVDKTMKEAEVPQKVVPIPKPPPLFPHRLLKKTEEDLEQMRGYDKFMKDMVTKKRSLSLEYDNRMQHCSFIVTRSLVHKKEDSGALTIPCTIRLLHLAKALCYLGENINLIPLSIHMKLGLHDPKPTAMRLLMDERKLKRHIEIIHDVLVKVESFIFSASFLILECEVDFEVPIILGRSFLETSSALVNMEKGQM
ncbi:uncharacterized protein LOC107013337 [Solanum pennellii]|uniref:Uncharacterized protein LOC107013337 n=1 Tax=Solanum pennellii TaxID=28526 RepID=A0ABM1GBN5_SOLPN|nr:uncharacterized protein LOC107013337 [Solanum pennellii]